MSTSAGTTEWPQNEVKNWPYMRRHFQTRHRNRSILAIFEPHQFSWGCRNEIGSYRTQGPTFLHLPRSWKTGARSWSRKTIHRNQFMATQEQNGIRQTTRKITYAGHHRNSRWPIPPPTLYPWERVEKNSILIMIVIFFISFL